MRKPWRSSFNSKADKFHWRKATKESIRWPKSRQSATPTRRTRGGQKEKRRIAEGRRKVKGIFADLLLMLWNVKASQGGNTSKVDLYWLWVFFIISTDSPGIRRISMTSKQLTMDKNSVIIVEKPEGFDFKLLKTSCWIIAVIQGCISRASKWKKIKVQYFTLQKQCKRNTISRCRISARKGPVSNVGNFSEHSPIFRRSVVYISVIFRRMRRKYAT